MQQQSQRGTFSTLMYFTDNQIKIKNNSNDQRNAKKKPNNISFNYWLAGRPIVYSINIYVNIGIQKILEIQECVGLLHRTI